MFFACELFDVVAIFPDHYMCKHQKLNLTLRVIRRLPPDPAPGPKEKLFEPEGDFKKNGELMLPTGLPLFVRLRMLKVFTENVSE